MRKTKRTSDLWKYLQSVGVLENGTEEQIIEAKKTYWKLYDREYKIRKRKMQKREIIVSFASGDITGVRVAAKLKGYALQDYIRHAVKADMEKAVVIPHLYIYREIEQSLVYCSNQLKAIKDNEKKNWLGLNNGSDKAEQLLAKLASDIRHVLSNVKPLKQSIEEAIAQHPSTLSLLQSILTKYGYQVTHPKEPKL